MLLQAWHTFTYLAPPAEQSPLCPRRLQAPSLLAAHHRLPVGLLQRLLSEFSAISDLKRKQPGAEPGLLHLCIPSLTWAGWWRAPEESWMKPRAQQATKDQLLDPDPGANPAFPNSLGKSQPCCVSVSSIRIRTEDCQRIKKQHVKLLFNICHMVSARCELDGDGDDL